VKLADRDRACLWHPYTQMLNAPPPLPIVRGEGVYLYTEDGRRILDGISSWWVNIHGHAHPKLNEALAAQAGQLEHVVFAGCTHPPAVELAEKLIEILPPASNESFIPTTDRQRLKWRLNLRCNIGRISGSGATPSSLYATPITATLLEPCRRAKIRCSLVPSRHCYFP